MSPYDFNPVKPDILNNQIIWNGEFYWTFRYFRLLWPIYYDIVRITELIFDEEKHFFIQKPKVSKNMLFGAVANIYEATTTK